jgi:hypothetical protein
LVYLQETINKDVTNEEQRSLEIVDKFYWCWQPANEHSGGMLLSLRGSVFEVGAVHKVQSFLCPSVLHSGSNRTMKIYNNPIFFLLQNIPSKTFPSY